MSWLMTPICLLLAFQGNQLETVTQRLNQAQRAAGNFRQPTKSNLQRAETLFLATLNGNRTAALKNDWRLQGFVVEELGDICIVREVANRGRGFYLFRTVETSSDQALQIPHGIHDLDTDLIGLQLFMEGNFRAATWNTIHRRETIPGSKKEADLAHLKDTYLQSFTAAWARHRPNGRILQLHGFAAEKRKEPRARNAAVILSNGTDKPNRATIIMAGYLNGIGAGPVAVYGRDTMELGGTTNAQYLLLSEMKFRRFHHLELSAGLRQRLLKEPGLRRAILEYFRE
ncbi:MAG: hypothetical protein QNK37_27725 [Acidobacteriota bacterium]|nr:hypothetical protein [Acidobacteriota bacterium]